MLPFNDIMLFIDVVKYQSFSGAADKNDMTPAGVSKKITKLEKKLAVDLLKRSTRKLALTEAGKILFEHCNGMNLELENILNDVKQMHQKPRGIIKISALQNFTNIILAPLLESFLSKYQDIEIILTLDGALGPLPQLGDYDIAFRSGRLNDSTAISKHLLSHDYTVCASPNYLKKNGTPITIYDLKQHNCLDCRYSNRNESNHWLFYQNKKEFFIPVQGNVYSNNALLIKNLALNHLAIIYSPSFIVANEINQGKLVPLLTQYKTIKSDISIIHPYNRKNIPQSVKTFIEYVSINLHVPEIGCG